MTTRLIERWLPIAALGIESVRERTPMTPFPAPNRLHVWWARRPLVASRAAVLASLLPADADRETFMHVLGIHGDPVTTKSRLLVAKRTGEDLGANPYGYVRAFQHLPTVDDLAWFQGELGRVGLRHPVVLDPTAGGGSIPFEAVRLGLPALANDLNPVATLLLRATVEAPLIHGAAVLDEFRRLAKRFLSLAEPRFVGVFPPEATDTVVLGYLWARTIRCPHCDGLVPLSPNWRLAPDGTGVRILPQTKSKDRRCAFRIVAKTEDQSAGTVAGGDGKCPFSDCERVIDGDEIKRQAQAGRMGEQLYCVVFKRRVVRPGKRTKSGKPGKDRVSWERGYRSPRPEDDNGDAIRAALAARLPEWEARGLLPTERIPEGSKTDEPRRYGMHGWRDLFSPRQLLCHGASVDAYRELLGAEEDKGDLADVTRAAFGYLAIALDKLLNYNSRMSVWMPTREMVANTFNRHDLAFCWSHAEMAPLVTGLGFDWAIAETGKCIEELVELARPDAADVATGGAGALLPAFSPPAVTITCKSADALDHVRDASIDAIVVDPPYGANVMYAELSDFFYVWLKRTAGHVFPELFRRALTDKENEAVANPSRHKGKKGAAALATRDYRDRMAGIFAECRRVLKPDGIMTVMFTHKDTGAWDALTTGLMQAGFSVSASWPVPTEAEGSLHIKEKSAANSTIFLVCRPRPPASGVGEGRYWEDVEPLVERAVRTRVAEFQGAGIRGVDLYLSCFGPALEEFSRHWPLRRGQPRPEPQTKKRRAQLELFQEEWDPYAVTPEDALDAARREVKRWRLDKITRAKLGQRPDVDPLTEWFVLAWDAFEAPVFPYDEALRLARVVGLDLDRDVVGRLGEKKGSDIVLWDSAARAAKGALGSPDGSRSMLDALHHAAHLGRTRTLEAARELLNRVGAPARPEFLTALTAVLEVLPVSRAFTKVEEPAGPVADSASDFEALENLRRLAFSDRVPAPKQLELWKDAAQS